MTADVPRTNAPDGGKWPHPRARYVYTLSDPISGEVCYVGCAADPVARLRGHVAESTHGKLPRHAWVRGLRARGMRPDVTIVEKCEASSWEEAERRWIATMRDAGSRLLNVASGGQGSAGFERIPWAAIRAAADLHRGAKQDPGHVSKRTEPLRAVPTVIDGAKHWLCGACEILKQESDFTRCATSWNGIKLVCRKCHSERQKSYKDRRNVNQ